MGETHPELHVEFKKGCFALKRTAKAFSRSPVDLSLEQTINADAAHQRTGINAMTNSYRLDKDGQKVILFVPV